MVLVILNRLAVELSMPFIVQSNPLSHSLPYTGLSAQCGLASLFLLRPGCGMACSTTHCCAVLGVAPALVIHRLRSEPELVLDVFFALLVVLSDLLSENCLPLTNLSDALFQVQVKIGLRGGKPPTERAVYSPDEDRAQFG